MIDRQLYLDIVSALTALIPIAIAALGGLIAWRQWRTNQRQAATNHHRLKLDLFDRRFEVYEATHTFLQNIIADIGVDLDRIREFRRRTGKAVFLFPDELV